ERLEAQAHRLLGQLLGVGRAVEKAEVGVAVQLGVGDRDRRPLERCRGVGAAGPGPGGAVGPVAGEGERPAHRPRQPALELGPRNRGVAPCPGRATLSNTCSTCDGTDAPKCRARPGAGPGSVDRPHATRPPPTPARPGCRRARRPPPTPGAQGEITWRTHPTPTRSTPPSPPSSATSTTPTSASRPCAPTPRR